MNKVFLFFAVLLLSTAAFLTAQPNKMRAAACPDRPGCVCHGAAGDEANSGCH